jgi:hypothetical protein
MIRVNNSTATAGGWSDSGGISSIGSPNVTGLNVSNLNLLHVGDYVTANKGFPSTSTRYRVIAKGVSSITLNINATSNETGISLQSYAGMYTDGILGEVPRTTIDSEYFNMLQEEIANTIIKLGGSLAAGNTAQIGELIVAALLTKLNVAGQMATGDLGVSVGGFYVKFDSDGRIVFLPKNSPIQFQAAKHVCLQYSAAGVVENGEAVIYEGDSMDWTNGGILVRATCRKGVYSPDHFLSVGYKGSGADQYFLFVDNAGSNMYASGGMYSGKTPGAGIYLKLEDSTHKIKICNSSGAGTIVLVGLLDIVYS